MVSKEVLFDLVKSNPNGTKIWYCDEEWVGPEYLIAVSNKSIMTVYRQKDVDFTEDTDIVIHPMDDNICLSEEEAIHHFAKTHGGSLYKIETTVSDKDTWWYQINEDDKILKTISLEDYKL